MPRKKKDIHYLYKTTCLVTDRYYVGMHSTNNLDDGYMGSGKRLRRSIRKYGIENHTKEILAFYDTRELLVEAEINAITEDMIGDNDCMNLMSGGTGGFISEEHHQKMRRGTSLWNERQWRNEEYRDKMSKMATISNKEAYEDGRRDKKYFYDWSGKTHTDETKKKISDSKSGEGKGKKNSQYGTMWIHCKSSGEVKKIKKEEWFSYMIKSNCIWEKGRKL